MKVRKIINKRFGKGSKVAGGLNAVISANVNEPGRNVTRVSSTQRIVQRGGRTVVHEERSSEAESSKPEPSQGDER